MRNGASKHFLTSHNPIHTGPTHTQQQRLSLVNVSDTKKEKEDRKILFFFDRTKDPFSVIKERTKKLNAKTFPLHNNINKKKYHTTKFLELNHLKKKKPKKMSGAASALFLLDIKGRVLIWRDYRGDVTAAQAERFFTKLIDREVNITFSFSI